MTARRCSYFKLGDCKFGTECRFAHSDGRKGANCKFYFDSSDENCKFGDRCYYLHSTKGFNSSETSGSWKRPSEPTIIELKGTTMTPEGTEWQSIAPDKAKAKVLEDLDTYVGWCTKAGVTHGIWLMKRGYDTHSSSAFTAFVLHAGRLPSTDEFECFEDDFTTGKALRPGRGEGLKDTSTDLSVFKSVLPSDIRQGSVGDCWLMSSMCALAEYPRAVMRMFRPKRLAADGKYDITLFHPVEDRFVHMVVDDRLPVNASGTLKYCKISNNDEIWPCLLEKAMAKLFGGYEKLNGNTPLIALKAFTQCSDCVSLRNDDMDDQWQMTEVKFIALPTKRDLNWMDWPDGAGPGHQKRSISEFFSMLCAYCGQDFLICAASGGKSDAVISDTGIVDGHAYSVLDIVGNVAGSGFDLMQLRNPWARQEWKGDWSDKSSKWEEYPDVRDALNPSVEDDGIFWIAKEDFSRCFDMLYVIRTAMPLNRSKERKIARKEAISKSAPMTEMASMRHGCFDCFVDNLDNFQEAVRCAMRRARISDSDFAPVMVVIEDSTGAKFPFGGEESCTFPVRVRYPVKRQHDERAPERLRKELGTSGHELFSDDSAIKDEAFHKLIGSFQRFDKDGNGLISEQELVDVLSAIIPDESEESIRGLCRTGDANHDGVIDYEEFVAWMFAR